MLTKIQQGGTTYDVAVPSEYTIEKMMGRGFAHSTRSYRSSQLKKY